jgi:multiple sugar transport system substrate-binding protein
MNQKTVKLFGLLLIVSLLLIGLAAQCGPAPTPQIVEKVVTVEVEKEVEKVVTQEVEKVVTVEVEKEVEKIVTVEVPAEAAAVAPAGSAADIAVEAANQYAGSKIVISYEAGLQAQDGYFFGPQWTQLTGIEVEVVEVPFEEIFPTTMNEALAGTSSVDVINAVPAWLGDFAAAGALEPLDEYIAKYYPSDELEDIHPTYLNNWSKVGDVTYGIPDDGDVHIMYYRLDLFEDEENQSAFEEEYGYPLAPPKTWDEWNDMCAFFTAKYAPDIYGCAFQKKGQAYHWFHAVFRSLDGEFFDPETMKAQVNNEIGVKTAETLLASIPNQPPGVVEWGFIEAFSAWMEGKLAMYISWPPPGRWSEGYGSQAEQLAWLPPTQVVGKVGYAIQPGGGELAAGFSLGVAANSQNKEAAYLFIQWLTSQDISLQRVMTPFALRDPYRLSHFDSALYKSQWTHAPEYLAVLKEGADTGYLDLGFIGSREYEEATEQAITAIYAGADVQETLDKLAADWDAITERVGVDKQREAYEKWAASPNAYKK